MIGGNQLRKIKVMSLIWSMGDGGAQQVVINYLRDFNNDPDIDFRVPTGQIRTDAGQTWLPAHRRE